jgi:hypothetical protein
MTGRDFLERYGITLAVVGVLALVLAILPGNAGTVSGISQQQRGAGLESVDSNGNFANGTFGGASAAGGKGGAAAGATGAYSGGGGGTTTGPIPHGVGGASAKPGVIFGKGLCRPDGRQTGISKYDPPCAEWLGGNGGSTSRGVTATSVKVARWLGQVDQATQAILQANKLADDPAVRTRSFKALFKYTNQHLMTYGREVQMVDYKASGPSDDDAAMKADGIKIANDLKAFAVIVGTPDAQLPDVLARELASRGVICICTVSPSSRFYTEQPPYIFGPGLPPGTLYADHIAEYFSKRLAGRKAKWAGDEYYPVQAYKSKVRRFGLVYINGANGRVDSEAIRVEKEIVAKLEAKGVKLAAKVGYNYEPGRNQNEITNDIAQLKSAGVTTVIMWVDPLYPILITPEATRQQYFPEWFITGSGLSDTTAAGRLYDQQQWQHAFGMSPLSVLWQDVHRSGGYRAAHHGDPSMQDGDEGALVNIYAAYVANVFLGIHMAGPILTPDSFAQGMYRFPKTGGTAAFPTVYFTRALPSAVKDFTEIWYDRTKTGNDERGESGTGMMMHVDNGRRYALGQWPRTEPKAFVQEGAITNTDNPPGGSDPPHEQDGHHHSGACMSCPGFRTTK